MKINRSNYKPQCILSVDPVPFVVLPFAASAREIKEKTLKMEKVDRSLLPGTIIIFGCIKTAVIQSIDLFQLETVSLYLSSSCTQDLCGRFGPGRCLVRRLYTRLPACTAPKHILELDKREQLQKTNEIIMKIFTNVRNNINC